MAEQNIVRLDVSVYAAFFMQVFYAVDQHFEYIFGDVFWRLDLVKNT
jgi:hypothetical protein